MSGSNDKQKRFKVALSFPGEHREYVREVADLLSEHFGRNFVLYDKYYEDEFARPNLAIYLPGLYRTESELVVPFLCPEYAAKKWCGVEWRHIHPAIFLGDLNSVMFLHYGQIGDLGELGIVPGDGYIDFKDRPAREVADLIIRRYYRNRGETPPVVVKPAQSPLPPPSAQHTISNLPFPSLGPLFKGRDAMLDKLRATLAASHKSAVVGRALHGLGGVGKTRLAVEYAWRYRADYAALLFVPAQDSNALDKGLADLAGVLDLPEKGAPQQDARAAAALRWLSAHTNWLLICDNVDDVAARDALLPRIANLAGGHVLITGRLAEQSPAYPSLPLDVLAVEDAAEFLLERAARRARSGDDPALARELAKELGGLALGLEQAAAYMERQQIGFATYLKRWRDNKAKVLGWFDRAATAYNHDTGLAATWMTSVAQLTPDGRRLLARLGWLAPDPIPDSLFDVSAKGDEDFDAREALADLLAYSLVSASGEDGKRMISVHRLVQDFARRELAAEQPEALKEALDWVDFAFDAHPNHELKELQASVLAPHILAVAEVNYGPNHPEFATRLGKVASVFRSENPGLFNALY